MTVTANYPEDETPIPMILHCPACGLMHVDEPTPEWDNPPHRSHKCQREECGCIWRPADVATAGVRAITTCGKSDTWRPGDVYFGEALEVLIMADRVVTTAQEELCGRDDVLIDHEGEDEMRILRDCIHRILPTALWYEPAREIASLVLVKDEVVWDRARIWNGEYTLEVARRQMTEWEEKIRREEPEAVIGVREEYEQVGHD